MKEKIKQIMSWFLILAGFVLLCSGNINIGILIFSGVFLIRKNDIKKYEKKYSNKNEQRIEQFSYAVYMLFLCFISILLYLNNHPLFAEDDTIFNMFMLLLISPYIPAFIRYEYRIFNKLKNNEGANQ